MAAGRWHGRAKSCQLARSERLLGPVVERERDWDNTPLEYLRRLTCDRPVPPSPIVDAATPLSVARPRSWPDRSWRRRIPMEHEGHHGGFGEPATSSERITEASGAASHAGHGQAGEEHDQ